MNIHVPNIIGWKDKDFQLGDGKQTVKFITDKLKEGWVILMGDMETIEMIERTVYTPGTEKNKGFALVMGKILPDDELVTNLFLAKKTGLFKQRIMYHCGIGEEVYDKLIMIVISSISSIGNENIGNDDNKDDGVIWDYSLMNDDDRNDREKLDAFASDIVRNILKME